MRSLICLLLIIICLNSCSSDKKENNVLNTGNLESFFVRIGPDKDTVIRTPKGASIKFYKGTFDKEVELEIKEAYTMKDILLAGLNTESDNNLLQSGGMIYINSRNGENLKLNKTIVIVLPTEYLDNAMKLYKGDMENEGINWTSPIPLETIFNPVNVEAGKKLFMTKCASCHKVFSSVTGPALAGLQNRGPWMDKNELLKFMRNPPAFTSTNLYAKELFNKWKTMMPGFLLNQTDIDQLLDFINYEERKVRLTGIYPSEKYLITDSIIQEYDTTIRDDFAWQPDTLKKEIVEPNETLRSGFTDVLISDYYYEFNIETLGWFNVDAEMLGLPGTELCSVNANLENNGLRLPLMNLYLFSPAKKMLSVGIKEGDNRFHFNKYENKIPLYLNDDAFVLAFGNNKEQFFYGISKFKIQKNQQIDLKISLSSKESFLESIRKEKLEGIDFQVQKPMQ